MAGFVMEDISERDWAELRTLTARLSAAETQLVTKFVEAAQDARARETSEAGAFTARLSRLLRGR